MICSKRHWVEYWILKLFQRSNCTASLKYEKLRIRSLRFFWVIPFLFAAVPATAQSGADLVPSSRTALQSGFVFPEGKPVNILLFRPDIKVDEETAGDMSQPNADWTQKARVAIVDALITAQNQRGFVLRNMPEPQGKNIAIASDYTALLKVIVNTAMTYKLFPGNKLPSKLDRFDWTLGPGVAQLATSDQDNYGLFIYSYDSIASADRNQSDIIGSMRGQPQGGGKHIGYAGLVDMKTGDLVWLNTDLRMSGDVRTLPGAAQRANEFLTEFPTRKPATTPIKKK